MPIGGTPGSSATGSGGRDADRDQRAGLDVRQDRREIVDHHRDAAGDDVLQRLAGALVGNVVHLDAGHRHEQRHAEMAGRADAR